MGKEENIHIRAQRSIMEAAFGLVPAPELERHLEECQKVIPILRIKAEALRDTNLAQGIVQKGREHPSILSRKDGNLIYFFERREENKEESHLVVLDQRTGATLDYKPASLEEFQSFNTTPIRITSALANPPRINTCRSVCKQTTLSAFRINT